MGSAIRDYFTMLSDRFGGGWNRFWFTPSDPFSLAVLRIAAGLMAMWFLLSYSFDLQRLFGAEAMLPVELIDQLGGERFGFSYLDYLHSAGELYALHAIGLAVVALFTLGLFARVTSVLTLVVVLSYIHRAPVLTGLFEPILTLVLFYLCLGPSGAVLSLDDLRRRSRAAESNEAPHSWGATVATRLVQVHLSVIYFMMAFGKLAEPGDTWWLGDAAWWLMARPESRVIDLTGVLYDHSYLINAWSHAIVLFELIFSLLIWNRMARPLLLALAAPMWISLALISGQTAFCAMMLIANLAYVSPAVLRGALQRPSQGGLQAV